MDGQHPVGDRQACEGSCVPQGERRRVPVLSRGIPAFQRDRPPDDIAVQDRGVGDRPPGRRDMLDRRHGPAVQDVIRDILVQAPLRSDLRFPRQGGHRGCGCEGADDREPQHQGDGCGACSIIVLRDDFREPRRQRVLPHVLLRAVRTPRSCDVQMRQSDGRHVGVSQRQVRQARVLPCEVR